MEKRRRVSALLCRHAATRSGTLGEVMDEFTSRHNIARFREMLRSERDPDRRRVLLQLLAEEEETARTGAGATPSSDATPLNEK